MTWSVYLSGEIHTDWRQQITDGCSKLNLPVTFCSAVTDHEASDAAGDVLGAETEGFWRDHKSSKVNGIRTRNLISKCDIAVVRFGENINSGMPHLTPDNWRLWVSPISHCTTPISSTR